MDATDEAPDIAVIGMAGRFPGAGDVETFWQNLRGGVESIRPVADAELEAMGVGERERRDPRHVKAAAVLPDMDRFDAAFFGFAPREAELMDPQHRVFLECAWTALEDAGVAVDAFRGAVGVFGGASTNTYLIYNLVSNPELLLDLDPMQIDVSNGADFLSTRVAYKLNLRGPSYTVQSACSTSLLAVHVACQSLLAGESDLALAGGVSIQVKHPEGYRYMPGGVSSPDGHCRAFDARADGTVFGSGAGVVILKRLEDALAAGDTIRAVIKGSAVNNDGSAKVGYTAPGADGQAAVIREALSAAGVEPRTIGVIEAHGTGTRLGDPIEVRALAKAFRAGKGAIRPGDPPCLLGSLKSNIGHLSGAAGIASLIKAVLMLEHRQIAPSLHFETPNPEMGLASTPFRVATELTPFPARPGSPRRAGVSSFGVGGTNVHVVLEEAPAPPRSEPFHGGAELLVISAKTRPALEAATANLARYLRAHPDVPLADVAHTLQVGRQAMKERRAVVCADREDAIRALEAGGAERLAANVPGAEGDTLTALAKRWLDGAQVDWAAAATHGRRRRVPLPTYPFERERYWIEARRPGEGTVERSAKAEEARPAQHRRPALDNAYVAPRNDLEQAVAAVWQQVLGVEPIGAEDSFFDLGGHSLLAAQLRNQIHAVLKVDLPLQSFFESPTVAAVAACIEEERRREEATVDQPIAERLRAAFPTDRQEILEGYLRRVIVRGLPAGGALPADGGLAGLDLQRLGAELEYELRRAFKFQLYPHEVRERPSLPALARHLLAEMDRLANPARFAGGRPLSSYTRRPYRSADAGRPRPAPARRVPSTVFVHSSPRAGSTLFRVMLAGHPQLFCPPEVNLLFFEDAAAWRENIGFGHAMDWTTAGLQWAFMELSGLDSEAGRALIDDLVARNVSAEDIYGRLEELARPRLLVDKTPSYALDLPTLRRAEAIFDRPKHIYLFRHPYTVMDSILRLRLDRLFARSLFGEDEIDPYVVAETVWALCNRNVLDFLDEVDEERRHLVRYEDLVRDPGAVMRGVCAFLGLPFDERTLQPYDGKRDRMIGGLGDPNILQHKGIEADLGEAWRRIAWPRRLDAGTLAVVERLGYEVPEPPRPKVGAEEAEQLLANLDGLPDDQVAALLEQLSAETKVR